jgi:hypothetical protein
MKEKRAEFTKTREKAVNLSHTNSSAQAFNNREANSMKQGERIR